MKPLELKIGQKVNELNRWIICDQKHMHQAMLSIIFTSS